jgi:suppressor for copper-sensitivity B
MSLHLTATFVVCKDICIPETITASLEIPAGESAPSIHAGKITAARRNLPSPENTKSLGIDTAVLSQNALVVSAYAKGGFPDGADLILETSPPLLFSPPEIIPHESDKDRAILKLTAPQGMNLAEKLFGKKAVVMIIKNGKAVERPFTF